MTQRDDDGIVMISDNEDMVEVNGAEHEDASTTDHEDDASEMDYEEEHYEEDDEEEQAVEEKKPFWKTPLGIAAIAGIGAAGVGTFFYVYMMTLQQQSASASAVAQVAQASAATQQPSAQTNVVQKGLVSSDQAALQQIQQRMAQQQAQSTTPDPVQTASADMKKPDPVAETAQPSAASQDLQMTDASSSVTEPPPPIEVPASPRVKEDSTPAPMMIGMTKKALDDVSSEIEAARIAILSRLDSISKAEEEQKRMLADIRNDVRAVRQMTRAITRSASASHSKSLKTTSHSKEHKSEGDGVPKRVQGWSLKAIDDSVAILQNRSNGRIRVVTLGDSVNGLGRIKRVDPANGAVYGTLGFVTGKAVVFD